MQKSNFIYQILSYPFFYILSQKIMSSLSFNETIIKKYVKKKHINVLDIGCGPADILESLNNLNYYGYDINESYINFARSKYKEKKPKLFCKKFSKKELKKLPKFDVILLSGLIHHLNDQESKQLLILCKKILKKKGKLITIDPILIKNQNPIARLLVKLDRGLNVRNKNNYLKLFKKYFKSCSNKIYIQKFIPYTMFVTCCKN
jgi:2-polyprenyl-3-methyl-5-hydroxy-6-metoxy-1,4-benzoquinol methylase